MISVNDEIHIQASKSIELIGGRSKLSLTGENIDFACPGSFTVKSSGHAWRGAGKGSANFSSLPDGSVDFQNWVEVDWHDADLLPLKNASYKLTYPDGTIKQGSLDANGAMRAETVPNGLAVLQLSEREPFDLARLPAARAEPGDWLASLQNIPPLS